ncbi:unnamed protein product [Rangifer tarandus platyrhynchus]|uniref:Uncharacterized protein n=2 Tax=Rangifer tarandus platyrhynchus TaxID=3082113 RepID=A0ACB0F200_RANTA|nr:unnamed protein product [Rangifer tarandus platyrhynchus]CAI9707132.1 unnamed protein product [Rangifer tarandus platyrhynchus]
MARPPPARPERRQRNAAAERCRERAWGRVRNPPPSQGPDPPGRGSRRSRPPPPLPPSPRGESPPPVAEARRHSLCSRSHSARRLRDLLRSRRSGLCGVREGRRLSAGGASRGAADTAQVRPRPEAEPRLGAGVSQSPDPPDLARPLCC